MSDIKSDIQIAREAKMKPIQEILAKVNVPDENHAFSPMGRHIAVSYTHLTLPTNREV